MAAPKDQASARRAFAEMLKAARDHLRLTQPQMAAFLRVYVQTYRNWEWEKTSPRRADEASVRAKIAALLANANTPWTSAD
jgi:DNA-binding transcriptional regulator YiaG